MVLMSSGPTAYCVRATTGTAPLLWNTRSAPQRVAFRRWRMITATCRRKAMMAPEKAEVLQSLEGWAESNLLPLLKPVEQSWQPHDLLPDSASPGFHKAVDELRARAREIPDDYYVCLVGNMVTEEALPTYHAALNSFVGNDCPTSTDAWARWSRGWTAEKNRHGDLLNRYLYLCGRVDICRVEQTIHHLINAGMPLACDKCPYRGFISKF